MKKFSVFLCLFTFMISFNSASAFDLKGVDSYDYLTGESQPVQLGGKSYTKGNKDYHFVPVKNKTNEYFDDILVLSSAFAMTANVVDPFVIKIDGVQYVMLKDNRDGVWDEKDILGFYDTPQLLFSSLVALNTNADGRLTPDELKAQNVRLAAVGEDKKLIVKDTAKDYDLNKINYIDIVNLRKLANSTPDGVFGHFNVYLKDGRMIIGLVTFSGSTHLENLF